VKNPSPIFCGIVGSIVCIVLAGFGLSFRRRKAKEANPKDFAFGIYITPRNLPRRERLRREFPELEEKELSSWISEFEKIETEIEQLAAAGGPQILGKDFIISRLKEKFPFLRRCGLKKAEFSAWHSAMHNGFDRQPLLKQEQLG
jgi:hypothetical protein